MNGVAELFDKTFYSVGLISKIPFECSQAGFIKVLQCAKESFGHGDIQVDTEKNRFELVDRLAVEEGKRIELTFLENRAVVLLLEQGYSAAERAKIQHSVFSLIQEHIQIILAGLDYIDKKVLFRKKTPVNPEEAFLSVADGCRLSNLLKGRLMYSFRPEVLFGIDPEGTRTCRLKMESNISQEEVRRGRCESENTLELACSVGQVRQLDSLDSLIDGVKNHVDSVRQFFMEDLFPNVVVPIAKAIEREESRIKDA